MRLSLFWRVFAVNAGLLAGIALLLLLSPVEVDAPIEARQALIVVGMLVITLATSAVLLRDAITPLERLARRMDTVDLLRPGQRLPVDRDDEVGRVVAAFNHMLDRLEGDRHENGRRVLAAQEAERIGIARDLHDEVGQLLTGVLLQLNAIAESAHTHRVGVVLRVVDDGRGFGGPPVEHGGLRSMRERALSIGGALAIKEGTGGGVDVRLDVPVARVAEAVAID